MSKHFNHSILMELERLAQNRDVTIEYKSGGNYLVFVSKDPNKRLHPNNMERMLRRMYSGDITSPTRPEFRLTIAEESDAEAVPEMELKQEKLEHPAELPESYATGDSSAPNYLEQQRQRMRSQQRPAPMTDGDSSPYALSESEASLSGDGESDEYVESSEGQSWEDDDESQSGSEEADDEYEEKAKGKTKYETGSEEGGVENTVEQMDVLLYIGKAIQFCIRQVRKVFAVPMPSDQPDGPAIYDESSLGSMLLGPSYDEPVAVIVDYILYVYAMIRDGKSAVNAAPIEQPIEQPQVTIEDLLGPRISSSATSINSMYLVTQSNQQTVPQLPSCQSHHNPGTNERRSRKRGAS